jgi:hypothetical protein
MQLDEISNAGLSAPALIKARPRLPTQCFASHRYGVSAMNQDQEHDYAYHQDKLLMLITRRARQQANSDQISKLDAEIAAINDLLRSYRILKAME